MIKTELKYKILRIRSKISFSAFIKGMTISELIYNTILKYFKNERANSLYNSLYENMESETK